ncbi:MAG TPA: response regulator, partial [Cytophagales bacterium]|nr:response regulator [Cytophagales bacterium]
DRLSLKRTLKSSGLTCTLIEATDASQGIDILKRERFDCIFLDYLLPGTDGLVTLRKIKQEGIKTPVIITTSQGDGGIAVEMMKSGAFDYIAKNEINSYIIGQTLRNALRLTKAEQEREEAEIALKISQKRLAEAQKMAMVGNWELNMIDRDMYWSDEVYRIFNLDKTYTPTLSTFLEYFHEEDRMVFEDLIETAESNETFNRDFRIAISKDDLKFVNIQGYVLDGIDLNKREIIGTIQDITQRKWYEEELIKARYMAEESMKIKEKFLANMSHEIRTPMNAIIGFTSLLLSSELTPQQEEFINGIRFSGENLLVIINDILDFSKIQSGKFLIEEIDFVLSDVLNPIMKIFAAKAYKKNIDFQIETDVSTPYLIGDPVRLNQILNNLIDNAIKFTTSGYVKLSVKQLSNNDKDLTLEFKVIDTGIGIAEEKIDAIFESFTQASSDTTRMYGGTGLGLSIVKNIVEIQKGTIKATSTLGKGSAFTIILTYKKSSVVEKEASYEAEPMDLNGTKVLLLEDNQLNQIITKTVLTNVGCMVDIAENGIQGIEMLKESEYDIVLMDIQMPEMDGYETTKHIRTKLPAGISNIPIIAFTADALSTESAKCFAVGMNDYISKPFKKGDLCTKIHKLLKSKQNPSASKTESL